MLGRRSAPLALLTAAVVVAALVAATTPAASAPDRDPTVRADDDGTLTYRDPGAGDPDRTLSGSLVTFVVEDPGGAHDLQHAVETADGTLVPVELRGELPQRATGGEVTARLDGRGVVVSATVEPAAPAPAVASAHRLYVAKATNFGDFADTDAVIAAGLDQALQRWVVESDGEISAFTRVGAFQTFAPTGSCSNGSSLWNQAGSLFPGVDFGTGTGNHLVVLVPAGRGCVFGLGTVGSTLADGGRLSVTYAPDSFYGNLMHELGHNVGLNHTRRIQCDPTCESVEYGNNYNFMGTTWVGSAPPGLDSAQRAQLGVLDACEAPTVTLAPGQRTVTQTHDLLGRGTGTGTRGLRFVDPTTATTYAADWRNRVGRDTDVFYGTWYAVESPDLRHVYDLGLTVEQVSANGRNTDLLGSVATDPPDGQAFSRKAGETFAVGGASVTVEGVDGTGTGESAQVTVTLTDPDVTNPPSLPAQSGTVAVSGEGRIGATVAATPAGWAADACFRYQWLDDGVAIPGARQRTFVIPATLAGHDLSVRVTGQRTGSAPRTTTSPALPVSTLQQFTSLAPRVTGTVRVASPLRAVPGTWTPAPTTWRYQWLANGAPVAGATNAAFTPPAGLVGRRIAVRVTGTRAGYVPAARTSAATGVVRPAPFARTVAPRVTGQAKVGRVLRVGKGTWAPAPTAWRYQWLANGKPVAGAPGRKATLRLTRAQSGTRISVRVTGLRPGYVTTVRTSARTGRVR